MQSNKNTNAQNVNKHCLCQTLDKEILKTQLEHAINIEKLMEDRPHLFSNTSIYISSEELQQIENVINAVETVVKSPTFKSFVLEKAPSIALVDNSPQGVFMGYDFHLTDQGPKLIEINTNAGGALLNLILAKAQVACCEGVKLPFDLDSLEGQFVNMFLKEWALQRGDLPLKCIAIMDDEPEKQYLYPEFQLFSQLFKSFGIECLILDPQDVTHKDNGLWFENKKIDLVYNRLTDFYFTEEKNSQLLSAYRKGDVVVTPNSHHHALFANKMNLETLTNPEVLAGLGVDSILIDQLATGIPKTVGLSVLNKEFLWSSRKNYFFKPASGFGSKAAYRGDKITHRVWEEINQGCYVAQEIAKPGYRAIKVGEEQSELKMDIRAYTYDGKIQLLASRLYSGQTTNFRTFGGGFAPVFLI